LGTRLFEKCWGDTSPQHLAKKELFYKVLVFLLTYMTYVGYHMAKRPITVVENSLNFLDCTNENETDIDQHVNCHWAWVTEMNGVKEEEAESLIGNLQSAYTFSYAFFMFFSGMVAERMNLRYYLSLGLLLTALATYLFGFAHTVGIHHIGYFYFVMVFLGMVNSTGWPGVVTALTNWLGKSGFGRLFGKGTRGTMMGIWNTHMYLGNILGLSIAAHFASKDWALCFMYPALIVAIMGATIYLFLIPKPSDVGLANPEDAKLPEKVSSDKEEAISFIGALKIPGVIEFSLCLFCAKLVSYVFLFWLPHYIKEETEADAEYISNLANNFDWGSMVGGIVAGFLSDQTSGLNALICTLMLIPSIPMMYFYNILISETCPLVVTADGFEAGACYTSNVAILLLLGFLINGPFSLITTAVSAELGQHESLKGSSKALATVTAIIDGTGSIGAAIGPLIASLPSMHTTHTIWMLMGCASLAIVFLARLLKHDIQRIINRFKKS